MRDSRRLNRCGAAAALLLAGLTGSAAMAAESCLESPAEVYAAGVVDARSLGLEDGRVVHVAGIEPFDLVRPDLHDAESALRQRLSELADGKLLAVQLTSGEADRYGRHSAMIAAGQALIQESVAGEGLAVAFASGEPLPCFDRILAAEDAARRTGRGFWAEERIREAKPELLAARIGLFTIFEGVVVSVGNRSARSYLNFGTYWSQDVTVEIEARHRKLFGGEPGLAALAGHRVRVRGFLEAKAGPMVAIHSAMQLEVLD